MNKVETFYTEFVAMFPEIGNRGTFTNQDVIKFKNASGLSIPSEVWRNKISRGVFEVPAKYLAPVVPLHAETEPQPEGVESTPVASVPHPTPAKPAYVMPQPEARAFVPEVDPNYVKFGNYGDVEDVIMSNNFYPLYITGLSGNGKSTMVEQICAKRKREMIRVNLNAMSDEDQLIGSKTLIDGSVQIVEGPVLIAMRRGAILLIDEIDAGSANALLCLQSPLEGKPYYFKLKNEMIKPKHGFNIIATANTKGKGNDDGQFLGTNILNEAFLERFGATFEQEYPNQNIEKKIILNVMDSLGCRNDNFAESLAKWADAIRRTYEAGGCDEIMSTRRIIHIVKAFSIFKNKQKAVDLCCNRFDAQTKTAFIEMFKAVNIEDPVPAMESYAPTDADGMEYHPGISNPSSVSPNAATSAVVEDWDKIVDTMTKAVNAQMGGGQVDPNLMTTINGVLARRLNNPTK